MSKCIRWITSIILILLWFYLYYLYLRPWLREVVEIGFPNFWKTQQYYTWGLLRAICDAAIAYLSALTGWWCKEAISEHYLLGFRSLLFPGLIAYLIIICMILILTLLGNLVTNFTFERAMQVKPPQIPFYATLIFNLIMFVCGLVIPIEE